VGAAGGAEASADAEAVAFHSHAIRFAVMLSEKLDASDEDATGMPSPEGCMTCLAVLEEMIPLLGPLAPTMSKVYEALRLCLLSRQSHAESLLPTQEPTTRRRSLTEHVTGEPPPFTPRRVDPPERPTALAAGETPDETPPSSTRQGRRHPPGDVATSYSRVPYFVMVRKLEEATVALQNERDDAMQELERTQVDVLNVDEQLGTARSQLQAKTTTIDKLMREQKVLDSALQTALARTKREEHRFDVLQAEAVSMSRSFLNNTQRLEEEVDRLKFLNEQLSTPLS